MAGELRVDGEVGGAAPVEPAEAVRRRLQQGDRGDGTGDDCLVRDDAHAQEARRRASRCRGSMRWPYRFPSISMNRSYPPEVASAPSPSDMVAMAESVSSGVNDPDRPGSPIRLRPHDREVAAEIHEAMADTFSPRDCRRRIRRVFLHHAAEIELHARQREVYPPVPSTAPCPSPPLRPRYPARACAAGSSGADARHDGTRLT